VVTIVVTSIICLTALLLGGLWRSDRQEQRQLLREMNQPAPQGQDKTLRGLS
jgi:FtsZ-interacting cell division protein ZipA